MNLIAYSDSEGSDDDAPSVPQPAAKPTAKPAFQKVVDRSNPGKIKLNLPGTSQPQPSKDVLDSQAPPAKRPRLGAGGGAFGGFNAMLPAPKKPKLDGAAAASSSSKRGVGKGLGAGVNLRTGAEPAFKREPRVDLDEYDENGNPVKKKPMETNDFRAMLNLPAPKSEAKSSREKDPAPIPSPEPTVAGPKADDAPQPVAASETKPVAARPKFRPMSAARGASSKKKKPIAKPASTPVEEPTKPTQQEATAPIEAKPAAKPKVSLFSIAPQQGPDPATQPTHNQTTPYQPLLYGANDDDGDDDDGEAPIPDSAFDATFTPSSTHTYQPAQQQPPTNPSNTLSDIATELNLSAAERRQLFGRQPPSSSSSSSLSNNNNPSSSTTHRLVEFNTDAEYAHNEMLRQQGETVQHNALKSISGTGKNSLRSLINVASTQKDALEEHFASGRRNKREAGSKYGW